MDPNSTLEAVGESAKALTKLQEILLKVFGPTFTKRQAEADAYADARKLKTIRDNPDMEIVYANGQMNARQRTSEALAFRAEQRQLAESIRQEENVEKVLDIAGQELQSKKSISDQPVDEDWLTRFFGVTKDVSSSDMQVIWGKILAGEISRPKSFSMRTLETIRNISSDEATVFESLLPFVILNGQANFIPVDLITFDEFGIPFSSILQMDECGLVSSSGLITIGIKAMNDTQEQPILYTKDELLSVSDAPSVNFDFTLRVYPLTRAAIELISIIDYSPNHDFFLKLAKKIHVEHLSNANMRIFPISYNEEGNSFLDMNKPIYTFCKTVYQHSGS